MIKRFIIDIIQNFYVIKNLIFKYYLCNLNNLFLKKIRWEKTPFINQRLIIEGSGMVEIGKKCVFGYRYGGRYRYGCIELQSRHKNSLIKFGSDISTNNNLFISCSNHVEIGSNTLIGERVTIFDYEAHSVLPDKRRTVGEFGKVIIGENVWIGSNVIILKNTFIGDNSVIAAGSIVNGDFPENVIIGGIPARVIKNIF